MLTLMLFGLWGGPAGAPPAFNPAWALDNPLLGLPVAPPK